MTRKFVVAANWKMHKSPREAGAFLREFLGQLTTSAGSTEVIFFVPTLDLAIAAEVLHSSPVKWGAQNCHYEMKGAFTGETSPAVLAELNTPYCLVGHSERRTLFHETDLDIERKVKALHQVGITPLLCVGESLQEREAGQTEDVILRQLREGLASSAAEKPFIIAYEPVWAIGTGKVATAEQANAAHKALRRGLSEIGGQGLADSTSILYGGSVKPENCAEIARQSDVDGFLVGGASLESKTFLPLCQVQTN